MYVCTFDFHHSFFVGDDFMVTIIIHLSWFVLTLCPGFVVHFDLNSEQPIRAALKKKEK